MSAQRLEPSRKVGPTNANKFNADGIYASGGQLVALVRHLGHEYGANLPNSGGEFVRKGQRGNG